MMKSLLLMSAALFASSAFAQHYEWDCSKINNNQLFADGDAAIAAGYDTYSKDNWAAWGGSYIAVPAQDLIKNEDVTISLVAPYSYATNGNSKYAGYNKYGYKLIMGMNSSTRDFIDPTQFAEGTTNNKYFGAKLGVTDQEHDINPAWIKIVPAKNAEGTDATTSVVTLKVNRGNNLGAIFVVDATKQKATVQTSIRNGSTTYIDNIRFQVEPGHEYYAFSSEKNSVEFYGITYDTQASDQFELLATEENCTDLWTCASINNNTLFTDGDAAIAAGFDTYSKDNWAAWGGSYIAIPAQTLIESSNIKAELCNPYSYATNGNSAYGGYNRYGYKLIIGMNSSSRDGLDATQFAEGTANNKYFGVKLGVTDQEHDINPANIKITIPAVEGDAICGRLMINWSRGGNNGALYVVDATKQKTEVQELGRLDNDHKANTVLCTIVNVYPGREYYILASEKNSVELYSIGFCAVTDPKFDLLNTTTSIAAVEAAPTKDNIMYNILGQRVTNAKGIVIMNGRKMIIK